MASIDEDGNTFFCWSFTGFLILFAVPMAVLIIGIDDLNNCEVESKIPIFMIVTAIAFMIFSIFAYCALVWGRWQQATLTKTALTFTLLFYVFVFAWNIAGSYWVFKEWPDWTEARCRERSYKLIFSLLIIYWILFPLHLAGVCWKTKTIYEDV